MDSENLEPDDFPSIIAKNLLEIDWYLYFVVIIAFLIVISDVFSQRVLQNINGALKGSEVTNWGHIWQSIGLVLLIVMGRIARQLI